MATPVPNAGSSSTAAGVPGGGGVLAVAKLNKHFGGVIAVDDVSFVLEPGTAMGLIGPNGAGKTTLFNLITGVEKPTSGTVSLHGRDVTGLKPHVISRLGIGRTFQTVRVFDKLTLLQNLEVADLYVHSEGDFFGRAWELLEFVGLQSYANTHAGELSYGQRKLLELAMVLMHEPSLLLLDEPVAGVNPVLIEQIGELMAELVRGGLTLLVVEHNVPFVVSSCSRVLVMTAGRVIVDSPPESVQGNPAVIEAFLGGN